MTLKNKIRLQQAEQALNRGSITAEQFALIKAECYDEQALDTIQLAVETKQLPSTSAKKKPATAKKGKTTAGTTPTVVAPDLSTAHVIDGTPNHPALPGLTADNEGAVLGNA